jgi:Zn-dependent protease
MLDFATLRTVVASRFYVLDAYIESPQQVPTFIVAWEPPKAKFRGLLDDLAKYGLYPILRRQGQNLVVRIVERPRVKSSRFQVNMVLFFATLATISYSSYLLLADMDPRLLEAFYFVPSLPLDTLLFQMLLFSGSIIAIIGLHELGHKLAAWYHRLDATLPYFLPGLPPIGTFGAVISLRSPPANKDQLFDLGFSGPFVGFVVTVIVGILSFVTSPTLSLETANKLAEQGLLLYQGWPNVPALMLLIGLFDIRPIPSDQVLVLNQVAFAAQIGALVTFLNILPVWQLDGGHISRAVFGRDGHRWATYLGLGILLVARYWVFAILLFVLMFGRGRGMTGVEPLDDVSPLSVSRRLVFVVALVMLALTFVVMG